MRNMVRAIAFAILSLNSLQTAYAAIPLSSSTPGSDAAAGFGASPNDSFSTFWGLIHTGSIDASFNCDGTFGSNFSHRTDSPLPAYSFVSPAGSRVDYLYGAAFWIGGIVGNDTLVTEGFEGWSDQSEMRPTRRSPGTFTIIPSPVGRARRCEFSDTLTPPTMSIGDHIWRPLGIRGILRAHWSDTAPQISKVILYDLTLVNMGQNHIEKGYIGLYVDPDIYLRVGEYDHSGVEDDLCGSFRESGTVYAIDAGRKTVDGQFVDSLSPTGALGVKLLATWPPMADTNFNWWTSAANANCDIGPRLRETPGDPFRLLSSGGTGTPVGDRDKYYMLRHNEWDYDSYLTGTIGDSNAIWMNPTPSDIIVECNRDIRFLLSAGPFDLPPDSSVRFLFAMTFGDSVHSDPTNFVNNMLMNHRPDSFYAHLDFEDLLRSSVIADSLQPVLVNPLQPLTGLHEEPKLGDTVTIAWDPWSFDNTTGVDIFLDPISPDSLPYPGVAAPWLIPAHPARSATIDPAYRYRFDNLAAHTIYAVSVANRTSNDVGQPCDPIFVQRGPRLPAPIPDRQFIFLHGTDSTTISWQAPVGVEVDHYCVYRFGSEPLAGAAYHPFYDSGLIPTNKIPSDSFDVDGQRYFYYAMTPYRTFDSASTSFVELLCEDSVAYRLTAVDKYGFETEFSLPIVTYVTALPTRDIVVLTKANLVGGSDGVTVPDSITAFYQTLLQGYDFEVYNLPQWDTVNFGVPTDIHTYADFGLLILDADLSDRYISYLMEDPMPKLLTQYLALGGRIASFGGFNQIVTGYYFKTYPVVTDYVSDIFSLDSISAGFLLIYIINHLSGLDTLTGFTSAESVDGAYPDIEYDTSRYVFRPGIENGWPDSIGPITATFVPTQNGAVTHVFRSLYPATSLQEGKPVGIHTALPGTESWAFGFHLWYMRYDQARRLIDAIMQRVPTGVDDDGEHSRPGTVTLAQNFPNPFNPSTTITYSVPKRSEVKLEIFNILGQNVRTLIDEYKPAGTYDVTWDGRDSQGRALSTGVYLYRLNAGESVLTKKMLLLK